jgi:hypothetical protein
LCETCLNTDNKNKPAATGSLLLIIGYDLLAGKEIYAGNNVQRMFYQANDKAIPCWKGFYLFQAMLLST